jgi:ankyrin repeat protein
VRAFLDKRLKVVLNRQDLDLRLFDVTYIQNSWPLLHFAVWLNDKDAVIELLQKGAEPSAKDIV